jgi:hypothetical protein
MGNNVERPQIQWRPAERRSTATTVHLRVELIGITPPIWRALAVSNHLTLSALHRAIQRCFNWGDAGAHYFTFGELQFRKDDQAEDDTPAEHAHATSHKGIVLAQFSLELGDQFVYEYETGEVIDGEWMESNWALTLSVEAVEESVKAGRPRCTGGARAAPPEDSWGPEFYATLLEWIDTPGDRDNLALRAWGVPRGFEPERFDVARVDALLKRSR